MVFYPFYEELQHTVSNTVLKNISAGNFGLWYNKFIPVSDTRHCNASDDRGNKDNAVKYYLDTYKKMQRNKNLGKLLEKKHIDQADFCRAFSSAYTPVIFKARLKTPLITGIGETHPHEISMVFDHTMGIPYIPASGIKGLVRFAHILEIIPFILEDKIITDKKSGKQYFDDEESWTNVPDAFGTQQKKGSVFFLDAYPETIPDLHIDIMNPHYGKYYNDDQNQTPPGDYLNPVPLKFLTVAKGTVFMFRALMDKDKQNLLDPIKKAFNNALTREGAGAKTAVRYGLFDSLEETESALIQKYLKDEEKRIKQEKEDERIRAEEERKKNMSEDDLLKDEEKLLIKEIAELKNDSNCISPLVKRCLAGEYEKFIYEALENKLKAFKQWKPSGSKQRKTKMKNRNAAIKAKINTEKKMD